MSPQPSYSVLSGEEIEDIAGTYATSIVQSIADRRPNLTERQRIRAREYLADELVTVLTDLRIAEGGEADA